MIKILFFLLITHSSFASTTLVIQRSSSMGMEQKAFLIKDKFVKVIKNTNLYDHNNDYRLGVLAQKKDDEVYKSEKRLNQISLALVAAQRLLSKKKTSFQKLDRNDDPHGDKIYLNKTLITKYSIYYDELRGLLTSLDTTSFDLSEGIRISKDKKKIESIKNAKVTSQEDLIVPFFCDKPQLPARCTIRNQGTLYLK